MDRTRAIFIAIVGITLLAICGVIGFNLVRNNFGNEPTPVAGEPDGTGGSTTSSTPVVNLDSPDPIWGPDYNPDDELPAYICGADAFGSYFTLQQMQMSGKDIEHGFHLGIVPFFLNDDPAYDVSEEQRSALLNSGQWSCLLTTLDSVALSSPGVITGIVDESAGADQLWGRDVPTINDLEGERVAFSRGSVGEYFVYYALSIAQLRATRRPRPACVPRPWRMPSRLLTPGRQTSFPAGSRIFMRRKRRAVSRCSAPLNCASSLTSS